MSAPISSRKSNLPIGCLLPFFAFFALIGMAAFIVNFVSPTLSVLRARTWTPTPCVIQSSAVAARGSGSETRFYPDVWYSYQAGGVQHNATEFNFFKIESKTSGDIQTLVNGFPRGANAVCFVNPRNPAQAVLTRAFPASAWSNLWTLLFVFVGAGGMIWQGIAARNDKRNIAKRQADWKPKIAANSIETPTGSTPGGSVVAGSTPGAASGATVLKPSGTRAGSCFGMTLMALFWNGIVGVFIWKLIFEGSNMGFLRLFLGLFLIPFALIGLLIFFGALTSFLSLFSSRIALSMQPGAVSSGASFQLNWNLQKAVFNPSKFSIFLEGREEATYTRGTDTITDKAIFHSEQIFQTTDFSAMQNGAQTISIPPNMMHSFAASNNKIVWSLKIEGKVSFGPEIKEEFVIFVSP